MTNETTIRPPLAPERLAEIEALEQAATRGPWGWRGQDDGSVELRGLHGMGPRIITTMSAPPCIDYVNGTYYLRDAESLPGDGPCETCTKAFASGDLYKDPVHCERTDTWDTVHVWNPAGFCEPVNRHTVREAPHRADVVGTTHPDAEFIAMARAAVPDLLAEVKRLAAENQAMRDAITRLWKLKLHAVDHTWMVANTDLARALHGSPVLDEIAAQAVSGALPDLLGGLRDRQRTQAVADEDAENEASCAQDTRIRELEQENDLLRARIQAQCEHAFPNDGGEPGDCRSCGMTYQQYDAGMGERIADALEAGAA